MVAQDQLIAEALEAHEVTIKEVLEVTIKEVLEVAIKEVREVASRTDETFHINGNNSKKYWRIKMT